MDLTNFYKNKRVLITGHTGFKGTWLCNVLLKFGAEVHGYSLEAPTSPSLYELCGLSEKMDSVIGDIRDLNKLQDVFNRVQPEIVFHMAAQPLVRESYLNPVLTYETNVMGTVNVLECIRNTSSVKSVVNVTTDKVYLNEELNVPFKEDDRLCGRDPYSNSKSCSELVTYSYIKSFFENSERNVSISTCRAGNVIGGGDFAKDRIIPDCYRAACEGKNVELRNPNAVRPFQHVLEPLFSYLLVAKRQYEDDSFAGNYNIGPELYDCVTVGCLSTIFCDKWNELSGKELLRTAGVKKDDDDVHEASFLRLDCNLLKEKIGYTPKWRIDEAVNKSAEMFYAIYSGLNINEIIEKQIEEYMN